MPPEEQDRAKRKPWIPPRLDRARDMLDDVGNLKLGNPETASPVSQTTQPSS